MTLALDGKLLLLFGESATFAGCTFEMIFAWLPYMSKGGQSLFDVCSTFKAYANIIIMMSLLFPSFLVYVVKFGLKFGDIREQFIVVTF